MDLGWQFGRLVLMPLFRRKLQSLRGAENLPASGGYIIAANHVDYLDGFFLETATWVTGRKKIFFLTKANFYWWSGVTIKIPVTDRASIVNVAVKHLQSGKIIGNFPEGMRNPDNKILIGHTGTVRMAVQAGVPVVPVGITADYGRNIAESYRFLLSSRHPVSLAIGQPMYFQAPPTGVTKEWLAEETKRLMEAIALLAGKHL